MWSPGADDTNPCRDDANSRGDKLREGQARPQKHKSRVQDREASRGRTVFVFFVPVSSRSLSCSLSFSLSSLSLCLPLASLFHLALALSLSLSFSSLPYAVSLSLSPFALLSMFSVVALFFRPCFFPFNSSELVLCSSCGCGPKGVLVYEQVR